MAYQEQKWNMESLTEAITPEAFVAKLREAGIDIYERKLRETARAGLRSKKRSRAAAGKEKSAAPFDNSNDARTLKV